MGRIGGNLTTRHSPLVAFSCPLSSEEETTQNVLGISPESQCQNLALTVLYVPCSLDIRPGDQQIESVQPDHDDTGL